MRKNSRARGQSQSGHADHGLAMLARTAPVVAREQRHREARGAEPDQHQPHDDDVVDERLRDLDERDLAEVEPALEHGGRDRLKGGHEERDAEEAEEPELLRRAAVELREPRRRHERRERDRPQDRLLQREDGAVVGGARLVGEADQARLQPGAAARPEEREEEQDDAEDPDLARPEHAGEQRVAREVQALREDLAESEEATAADGVTRDRRRGTLLRHPGVRVSQTRREPAGRAGSRRSRQLPGV